MSAQWDAVALAVLVFDGQLVSVPVDDEQRGGDEGP